MPSERKKENLYGRFPKLSHANVGTGWRAAFHRAAAVVCMLLGWSLLVREHHVPRAPPVCKCARIAPLAPELRQEAHCILQAPDRGQSRGES